jgi:signal transduction histidine kinase
LFREIYARGMFYWLRAPRDYGEVRHDEWALAIARLVLSAGCMGVIIWEEGVVPGLHLKLLFAFLIYSLLILAALRVFPQWHPLFHAGVHFADTVWAAPLIVLVGHPSVFFVLALFVIANSVMRWGFWEALLTIVLLCTFIPLMHLSYGIPPQQDLRQALEVFPYVLLGFAIAIAAGLIAEARASRSETYSTKQILQDIRLQTGFEAAIQRLGSIGLRVYGASRLMLAIHNNRTGQGTLLQIAGLDAILESREIRHSQHGYYFFPAPGESWRVVRTERQEDFKCHTLDAGKVSRDKTGFRMPDGFMSLHPFSQLLAVSAAAGDELSLRFYIVDPQRYFAGADRLRYLDRMVRQAVPTIHDQFQVGCMRTDAEAAAGSRMARDLHDGVIQTLAGINLQLDELRQQASSSFPQSGDRLACIQKCVQDEIASLREFTQQLRTHEVDSSNFLGYLSNAATKFQCEHGITTRFISELDAVKLSPFVCGKLARIVLEALVNVRKHSQASEIYIRLGSRNGDLVIGIFDNGRGFGFSGQYTHEELLASGKGPAVIMERARSINARVSIESVEGSGSCLEISLPQ